MSHSVESGLPEMLERAQKARLDLTDTEWMSIINRERDGLPPCCANISALRDVLVAIASDDGDVGFFHANRLVASLGWCFPSHDIPSDVMQKVIDQLGVDLVALEHLRERE